jgi:hypothetical protein
MSPTGDLHVTAIFSLGRCRLELAQALLRVALAWHVARRAHPTSLGSTIHRRLFARARRDANPYGDGF